MITVLLILHGILAVFLVGAITHQAIGVWKTTPVPSTTFLQSLMNTRGAVYADIVGILYLLTMIGGAVIYPTFVLDVKGNLVDSHMDNVVGAFEIKEHFSVIGLAMLPAYWYYWKKVGADEHILTRRLATTLLALLVWWNFVVGHIVNNVRGVL